MKMQKQREIVIEFERVQLIRKRAKTHLINCRMCRRETDFIPMREVATLFSTNVEQLFEFIKTTCSHYEIDANGEIFICLISLLTQMKAKTNISQIKLIGETKI